MGFQNHKNVSSSVPQWAGVVGAELGAELGAEMVDDGPEPSNRCGFISNHKALTE